MTVAWALKSGPSSKVRMQKVTKKWQFHLQIPVSLLCYRSDLQMGACSGIFSQHHFNFVRNSIVKMHTCSLIHQSIDMQARL